MFTLQYIALKRSRMENSDPTHPMDYLTGVLYHIIQNAQETPLSYKIPAALNEMVSLKRSQEVLEKQQIEEQVLALNSLSLCFEQFHEQMTIKCKHLNVSWWRKQTRMYDYNNVYLSNLMNIF